jgi:hypothetical protein
MKLELGKNVWSFPWKEELHNPVVVAEVEWVRKAVKTFLCLNAPCGRRDALVKFLGRELTIQEATAFELTKSNGKTALNLTTKKIIRWTIWSPANSAERLDWTTLSSALNTLEEEIDLELGCFCLSLPKALSFEDLGKLYTPPTWWEKYQKSYKSPI